MKSKRLVSLFLALCLLLSGLPTGASAASGWMSERSPYQYTSVTKYAPTEAKGFTVGGKTYYEGYVFYCWYQTSLSQVLYNLKGEYKTFEFDIGRVDGTKAAPAKLFVYKDGLIVESIDLNPSALKTHVTLDVEGVKSLKLVCQTQGHYYDVYYGVFNGQWTSSGKKAPAVVDDAWIYDCEPYDSADTDFFYDKDGTSVPMGGDDYSDAVRMYLWNPAGTATVSYNLSGDFKSFSFLFGHVDSTTRATGILTVKLDGKIDQTVTLEPDSLPVPVTVNLTGKDQMILEFNSSNPLNTYDIYYGIGNGKFVSNGNARAVYLSDSEIKFQEGYTVHQLQADVRPRDAGNKKVTWSSSDTSVASVSNTGKVTAVGAGTAQIIATTADGGYTAACKVTVPEGIVQAPTLAITREPSTGYAQSGKTVSVSVEAQGEGLTYQWYIKNATASKYSKSSITKATYSCTMNNTNKDRLVYCVVTDRYGNEVKSKTVPLRMSATITTQPKSVTVAEGATAKVTVKAAGDDLTYRWYYKDAGKSSYTYTSSFKSNTYSVQMNSARDGRRVLCKVYDKYGNMVQSASALLTMQKADPVKITAQPVSVTVAEGETAKVTVKATGDGLTYQWYFKDAGASKFSLTTSFKSNTYSVSMTDARNGRQVYCKITDKYGNTVTSSTATLKMEQKNTVQITAQPKSVTVAEGETAKVTVKATGDGLTYKWYYKDAGKSSYTYTSSFKSNTYSVTMNAARNGRRVLCKVYDKYGNMVQSSSALLSMK